LAAKWRGVTDEYFDSLPLESQARILAAYRTAAQLESVQIHHPPGQKKRRR
jgi:hypothetical protein